MVSFATELPLSVTHSSGDFLETIQVWLLGSPHTKLESAHFDDFRGDSPFSVKVGPERLESMRYTSAVTDSAAIRYTKQSDAIEWVTTVVFSKTQSDSWVGIRTSCESEHPSASLPQAKKPVLVRTLQSKLQAGKDGPFVLQQEPHFLADADIDLAARLINEEATNRLPVVYVSAHFIGLPIVDLNALSKALVGMAHVVVEPNRQFSIRLKEEVNAENVYGGTVGIYWPDGGGRRSYFLGQQYASGEDIQNAIIDEVTEALANRRPLARCTWSAVQELVSQRSVQALKDAGSRSLDQFTEEFDRELKAKAEQLAEAEREISRLNAELRKPQLRRSTGLGISFSCGVEQELYADEISSIVRDALEGAPARAPLDSRRSHVLQSVLSANPVVEAGKTHREKLKDILRGYKAMDARTRAALKELGFEVAEDGKHFKLVYQGDERYTFTLPKSGSDWRGGLNAASDIARLLF